jgi:membrane-bound lytic murein transglycosylase D
VAQQLILEKNFPENSRFTRLGQFFSLPWTSMLLGSARSFALLVTIVLSHFFAPLLWAQSRPFPMLAELEVTVEFWKQIFTRYSFADVVLFDPMDPGTIYSVVRAPDTEEGRALIERERARIGADYDLADPDSRLRSQRGAKEHFAEGLKISGRYIGEMKKIFREEGVPEDLTYLPLVESSFNVRARSPVGAVGMWQFMPDTGRKFLRIDAVIDERRDPFASTRAAARLLKQNYRLFENWPLAITAYNHGTEGIFRGIKAVESENLVDLIKRYQSPTFGFASKNFYAEFLAVVEIATRQEAYFPFLRALRPLMLREVEVKRQAPLHAVLKPAAIPHSDFFEWNPALDRDLKALPVGYRIKLPPQKVEAFTAAERRAWDAASKKPKAVKASASTAQKGVRVAAPKPTAQTAARSAVNTAVSGAKPPAPAVKRAPIKAGL